MDTAEGTGTNYLPRAIDPLMTRVLESTGAAILEGPRGCGKTMTGLAHASSYALLDTPEAQTAAEIDPHVLLAGASPRLLDEWQLIPQIWNLARREVDFSAEHGRFILTGSAVPAADPIRHTGATRFIRVRQRTMTWAEKDNRLNDDGVSLRALLDGVRPSSSMSTAPLDEIIRGILRPGFPGLLNAPPDIGARSMESYIKDIATTDLNRLANLRSEPAVIEQLIPSLARSTASDVSQSTLRRDISRTLPAPSEATVAKLLELLERVFILEPIHPWAVSLRSKARLRRSPKYHLADPALAAAALHADAARLGADLETLGFLFESAVIHDLLVYTEALGGHLYHYRDSNGHEIDAVITMPNGTWAAIEVKIGGGQVQRGAQSLASAIAQIDMAPPAFKAVITGTGFKAALPDGTITFPLHELRP